MASDRPVDSYEGLTGRSMPVDKRVPGRDAGLMINTAILAANGTLFAVLLVVGIIALFGMAGFAIFKMRKDDFWDEQG